MNTPVEKIDSHDSFISKRDQLAVEIRKKKTNEIINLKRTRRFHLEKLSEEEKSSVQDFSRCAPQELTDLFKRLSNEFIEVYSTGNLEFLLPILKKIRRGISQDDNPPVSYLIETKILPTIAKFLDQEYLQFKELQNECAWIISNVAAGKSHSHSEFTVDELGAIHRYITLLSLYDVDLRLKESATWGLANIIADDPKKYGSICIQNNLVSIVVDLMKSDSINGEFLRTLTWLMHQICKSKAPFEYVVAFLPEIQKLFNLTDEGILSDSLWALKCIADVDDDDVLAEIINMECTDAIIEFASCKNYSVRYPALGLIALLLAGDDDEQTKKLLCCPKLMPTLVDNLSSSKSAIKREAAWAISNICAGKSDVIEYVLKFSGLIEKLLEMTFTEEKEVVKEVIYCFNNATSQATREQIHIMAGKGLIKAIVNIFKNANSSGILQNALETISQILEEGHQICQDGIHPQNIYLVMLENEGGVKAIEGLQNHPDEEIYKLVDELIESYFDFETQ